MSVRFELLVKDTENISKNRLKPNTFSGFILFFIQASRQLAYGHIKVIDIMNQDLPLA